MSCIVIEIAFHSTIATGSSLTKEDILQIYQSKQDHVRSWATKHSAIIIDAVGTKEWYIEQIGRGEELRRSEYEKISPTEAPRPFKEYSLNPSEYRELEHPRSSQSSIYAARIGHADPQKNLDFVGATPLGYSGLLARNLDPEADLLPGEAHADLTIPLRSPDYLLKDSLVTLDGQECYVLYKGDPPNIQWYLSVALGLAVVRYEEYRHNGKESAFLQTKIDFEDFVEAKPGFYVPYKVTVHHYSDDSSSVTSRSRDDVTNILRLETLELNPQFGAEDFNLDFPPGTYVLDEVADGLQYRTPDVGHTGEIDSALQAQVEDFREYEKSERLTVRRPENSEKQKAKAGLTAIPSVLGSKALYAVAVAAIIALIVPVIVIARRN